MAENSARSGRVAFTYPDFVLYQFARFISVLVLEMLSVAVGWQVYEITHRALDLGLVGLAQFLPGLLLFLPAGHAVDRLDRRKLLGFCYLGFAICSAWLLGITLRGGRSVRPIFAALLLLGVVRSF